MLASIISVERPRPGNDFVAFQDFDHDLAQCVLTFGDRLNRIVFQRKILLYNPVNRLKGSVNRALTSGDMLFALPVFDKLDNSGGRNDRTAVNDKVSKV